MRDTYGFSDFPPPQAFAATSDAPKGLRHSIRPRRTITEPVEAPAEPVAAPEASQAQYDVARNEVVAAPQVPVSSDQPAAAAPRRVSARNVATPRPAPVEAEAPAPRQPAPAPVAKPRYVVDPSMPRWHELAMVETGSRQTARTAMPVADAARDSTSVRAFDLLRTRLRQTTQEHGWTNIAIVSPTAGCGTTFTAVNLALSLSRISNSRTVLMDLNLRSPSVAKAFDVAPRGAMRDFLKGHTLMGDHMVRVSETLALGLNNRADSNAADTLQAPETARTLERMRAALQPELVIYDMPAMLAHDDLSAFLPQLDGVLMVSDGTKTMGRDLLECERMLEGRVPLLGVVLNRARKDSVPHYD